MKLVPIVAVVLGIVARGAAMQDDRPQSTFRSGTAAVIVDVNVRDRAGRPITNLKAQDFELRDNGVVQAVQQVSYGKVPIDVTVALDVSFSVTGDMLTQLRRAISQLMRDLGRDDRLRLLLFNMQVVQVTAFTTDEKRVQAALEKVSAGGGTALRDAVSLGLVSASDPDRRQLLMFFTDGRDSSSITPPDVLASVAQRMRGAVTFVVPGASKTIFGPMENLPGVRTPLITTTVQRSPTIDAIFHRVSAETGGSVLTVSGSTDVSAAFQRVLTEFRSTYVLYYVPRGVETGGYHQIAVKVPRDGAQIRARRGYFGGSSR